MNDAIDEEERAYWTREAQLRSLDVEAARTRGDALHLVAGAQLRLTEANNRLAALQRYDNAPSSA